MYNFTSLNSLMYVVDSNSNSGNETAVPRAMWAPGEDDSNRAEPLSSPRVRTPRRGGLREGLVPHAAPRLPAPPRQEPGGQRKGRPTALRRVVLIPETSGRGAGTANER